MQSRILKNFVKTVDKGLEFCSSNKLVTFGVIPTSPETGYGYIKAKKPSTEISGGLELKVYRKTLVLKKQKN